MSLFSENNSFVCDIVAKMDEKEIIYENNQLLFTFYAAGIL